MKLFEVTINAINLGLWLAPDGNYIKVESNHVSDIINNPSKFGVTDDFVTQLYDKHNERFGVEGNAREELIKLVLQRGWVRIRNYRNYWSVTVDRLTPKVVNNIRNWVDSFIEKGIMGKYADIKVLEVSRDKLKTVDAIKIVTHHALEESFTMGVIPKMITETKFENLPDLELLTEVKLSRVYNIFTNPSFAVGIISAFRGDEDKTLEINIRNNKALATDLRNAGFGYSWIDGAWIENRGTEEERHASEVSILVTSDEKNQKKLFDMLVAGAKQYNQDAFIFQSAGENAPVKLYDKNGEVLLQFNNIRMDDIADNYSRLRSGGHAGRSFVFEGVRDSVGYFGRLAGKKD